MRLAITAGNSPLAHAVCAVLPSDVQVRLIDTQFTAPPEAELCNGDLRDPTFADRAVAGADVVLHIEPIVRSGDDPADLDRATRGTYQIYTAAAAAGVRRFLLGSTLALFDRLPPGARVDERWRPRPTSAAADLCAWLSEICVRELVRDLGVPTLCLRFGRIVDDTEAAAHPNDPRRLHIADAADAVRRALAYNEPGWSILHIAAGPYAQPPLGAARTDLGFEPQYIFQHSPAPANPPNHWRDALIVPPAASRPVRRVVIFGAGGPLASSVTKELAHDYLLRLTDIEPLAAIAARGQPQLPGAPLPDPPGPPHEITLVDVTDPDAVLAACAGADAIINCSVIRRDPVEAFRVNALGAYNILRAAVAHGITRVVHTGPYQVAEVGATGYLWDYDVPDEAPPRPGCNHQWQLYLHSKWLGQEICRVFAETYGLSIPALLFVQFVNPEYPERPHLAPFAVSWRDAARAVRAALETTVLPSSYEVFHVSADLPHGVFRFDKIRRVLGWEAQDTLEEFWRVPPSIHE